MALSRLSDVLWQERHLLELLLFKLEEEQLILSSGRTRWLGHATREVEQVLDQIRTAELGRSVEAEEAAQELRLEPGCSLRTLAGSAPAPWGDILVDHHSAFVDLTDEIHSLAQGNRDLLSSSYRATRETLLSLQDTVDTYGPRGSASSFDTAQLVDRAL